MQTIEIENTLNLAILPAAAQQELIDFYQFLVNKYADKPTENTMQNNNIQALKGVFNQYSDTSKRALEKSAWQNQLLNKHYND